MTSYAYDALRDTGPRGDPAADQADIRRPDGTVVTASSILAACSRRRRQAREDRRR